VALAQLEVEAGVVWVAEAVLQQVGAEVEVALVVGVAVLRRVEVEPRLAGAEGAP